MTASTCIRYSTRRHTTDEAPRGPALQLDDHTWLPLRDPITRVGCGLGADLQLDDHSVAQRHAILVSTAVGVVLLDDSSGQGCFVNGRRTTRQVLEDGDEIALGRVNFRFADG